jgi:hypothetical protein
MASAVIAQLTDAADEELRPLLLIRHVTVVSLFSNTPPLTSCLSPMIVH